MPVEQLNIKPSSIRCSKQEASREELRDMAGGGGTLGENIEMRGKLIKKAWKAHKSPDKKAWKAHKSPDKPYHLEKIRRSSTSEVIISFPGSDAVEDWYSEKPFGETKIDLNLFPSLKSLGNNEAALVNEAFLKRFKDIHDNSSLVAEVDNAMTKKKQIVFTGHSSGAPVAILATLWALEKYLTPKSHGGIPPLCVTFGSPLVGNHIFSHATRRENWSGYFIHFVMRYDIVPRILLAPLSSFEGFEEISEFFNPKSKSKSFISESVGKAIASSDFYFAIMSNAATVTSHAACKLTGSTDVTLETMANFIPLSPYRPFGTYIFCTGNGKTGKRIVVRNPDAVLQLLFFSAQLSTEAEAEAEAAQVASRSLREHTIYVTELQKTLGKQNVVYLDQLEKVPLCEDGSGVIDIALNDLGLSTRARLCLRASAELEERRRNNEEKMKQKKEFVEEKLRELEKYKKTWEQNVGYYDAFKLQKDPEDFKANVKRLELAGVWDEIIEMLRKYELPDEFEGKQEWVNLGTWFRKLAEPIDIANYYRHVRHHESGPYMDKGRPKRYRYPQRWLEHAQRRPEEPISESSFLAEVEDLCYITTSNNNSTFEDVKERVVRVEDQIKTWTEKGEVAKDVFLDNSSLVKWWKTLPPEHKQESCIRNLIEVYKM